MGTKTFEEFIGSHVGDNDAVRTMARRIHDRVLANPVTTLMIAKLGEENRELVLSYGCAMVANGLVLTDDPDFIKPRQAH